MRTLFIFFAILFSIAAWSKDLKTNSLSIQGAPDWVTKRVVERVTDKVEGQLEWKTRRVPVIWHSNHESYSQAHSLGALAAAVTVKSSKGAVVHIGPLVTKKDYGAVLGHELVHVIFHQKFSGSIPDWLEEGLANYLSRNEKVDVTWLAQQKIPEDVSQMGHPFQSSKLDVHLQYKISQALVQMLDEKCDLKRLLRLSVERKIETYIEKTCGISNINKDFKDWLKKKALKVRRREKSKHYKILVEEVVSGLHIPWGFEFLDEDRLLINEKKGRLSLYNLKSQKLTPLSGGPKVVERGQGGALDVKKHPQYPKVPWIYTTYVAEWEGKLTTHLARFQIQNNSVVSLQELFKAKGGTDTNRHFGSRIAFDHEGFLYMSIGDRGHRPNGQNLMTHAGSIVRLHEDGRVPKSNPFVGRKDALPEIWSYGHRNPQGLVFDPVKKVLWEIEHGPRGGDEINLIEKGKNYGWARISYGKEYTSPAPVGEATSKPGMEQPVHYYVPSIAPCGMDIYHGNIFPKWRGDLLAGALKLTHLNRVTVKNGKFVAEERLLKGLSERIRQVKVGPKGYVYLATDSGDILRLRPEQ